MIVNNSVTIYHKGYNDITHQTTWTRKNYSNVWIFGGKGSSINKGYDNANDLDVRIPYGQNEQLDIANFSIGDIVIAGTLNRDITRQQELEDFLVYNITSINDNNFGHNPHIHLGAK